jgi:predicted dehydrogenase
MRPRPPSSSTTRRDFLRGGVAAAGALAAGSSGCAGASWSVAELPLAPARAALDDAEPVRVGLIGLGGMGRGHLDSLLRQIERGDVHAEVVALADVCAPRLQSAGALARERRPDVRVEEYADHRELLARDDVHGVIIASPEHWHAEHAVAAIGAGKDAYVEKPLTLRLDDALRLRALMTKNPHMRLQVGTQYMMWERYREAKRLIAEGALGKVVSSQTSYCRNSRDGEWLYAIDPDVQPGATLDWDAWCGPLGSRPFDTEVFHRWRRYREFSTGIVGDLLVHMLTPLMDALGAGWPVRVTASGGRMVDTAMENHDQLQISVEFADGQTLAVNGSTCNEQGLEPLIRGHEANLYLGGNDCVLRPERVFADDVDPLTIRCDNSAPQEKLRLDWLDCVRTREQNVSRVELACQVMVVVDLATRSLWEGHAFRFDPLSSTVSVA